MANQGEFQIVEFSPELKAAIMQYAEIKNQMGSYLIEAYKEYPDTRKCDIRDFAEMIEVAPDLTADEMKENCINFVRDYTGSDPDKRKNILDNFYNRFEDNGLHSLNLDCLKGEDKGTRGSDRLTDSERDVMKLITKFRCTQSIGTKMEENPEYVKERFGDARTSERFNAQSDAIHVMTFYMTELLAKNHLDPQLSEVPYDNMGFAYQTTVMDIVAQRAEQVMAGIDGRETQPDIHFSLSQEKNGLYGLDQGLLPNQTPAQMDAAVKDAYDSTFGAVYNGHSAIQRMEELGVNQLDLIYIDGISAAERFGGRYQNLNLDQVQMANRVKLDVMRAVMEGSHHIDLVTLDMDQQGNIVPNARGVKVDLHGFDQMERQNEHGRLRRLFNRGPFKIKTRADQADRINSESQSAEERLSEVIPNIGDRLAKLKSAKRLHEMDLMDFGLQKEPDSPRVSREKEKLEQIQARIDEIKDKNRPLEVQAAELKNRMDAGGRLEKARQRVGRMEEKAKATGTVKTDGCLTDLEAGTAMETVLGDYSKEEQDKAKDVYLKEFLPNFGRMNGVWQTNGMGKEQLEQRRVELTAGGQSMETPFHLEVIDGLLAAGTPEAQQAYRDSVLKDYLDGADRYGKLCGEMLERHPAAGFTDQMKNENKAQIEALEGQILPVPETLLKERAEQEARIHDFQELDGKPAELTSSPPVDYQAPKTREEAVERIAALDAQYGPAMEYNDKCARVAQAGVMASIDTLNPYNGRYQAQVLTDYFDKIGINTGSLGADKNQSLEESRKVLMGIAKSKPGTPIPHDSQEHGSNMMKLYMEAINSDPVLARFGAMGQEFREDCTHKSAERERLIADMRGFGKEERLEALAAADGAEKNQKAPAKEGAVKDAAVKENPEKEAAKETAKEAPKEAPAHEAGPAKEEAGHLKQGRKEVSVEHLKKKEMEDTKREKEQTWEGRSPSNPYISARKMDGTNGIGSHRISNPHPGNRKH